MRRLLASSLLSALCALGLGAAESERLCEDLDEILVVRGENVSVTGLWQISAAELSATNAALTVCDGSLRFCEGVKFRTDDFTPFEARGDVLLWRVENGSAFGVPVLDPPNEQWRIVASENGRVGRLVRQRDDRSLLASLCKWGRGLAGQFHLCFFANQRWRYLTNGLLVTLQVALCAVLLGAFIGFVVAIVRVMHDKNGRFPVVNAVLRAYLTVIRGTPMAVQLLIAYFIVFASCTNKTLVAILAFGLNSGAYVAEIMRAGIVSIDDGQMEAGRSLGLSYARTMVRIVLPQAVRNVLPALGNEFIVLLKDTSIASFIALQDLAKGGEIIRSQTYDVYMPFLMVAAIYLVLVMFFTFLLGKFERHLRNTGADVVHEKS